MKPFSAMSQSDRDTWADREFAIRAAEMRGVKNQTDLIAVQSAVKNRRDGIGIDSGSAASLMISASRRARKVGSR